MLDEPIRVMALHALAYCERLFYLEEVEEIRLADADVFSGRALHEEIGRDSDEDGQWINRDLSSERLGLVGRVDVFRRRDGALIPYEHKKGRARKDGKKAGAWPADALQVTAYALLLEEESGENIPEGRIRYHADKSMVRVSIDETARRAVAEATRRARELRRSNERPPVAANDRLCLRCSLSPVCLPEEERLAANPEWSSIRLFPADRELKTIHVSTPGSRVSRSGDTLQIYEAGDKGEAVSFPIREVGGLVMHGYAQITTQALHFCAYNDISVQWLSGGGRFVAGMAAGAGRVQRRLRQYEALSKEEFRVELARKTVMAKIESALRYTLRSTRGLDRHADGLHEQIERLRECLRSAARCEDIEKLRGHEGLAGRTWFAILPTLLQSAGDSFRPNGRSRRPPRDRFNALLGFGYALLYQSILQAILTVGLEPALGYYHQPRSSAHPLVMDLMELFRLPVWDMPLIGSVNRQVWHPDDDFEITGPRVWLSASGRKKAIQLI